MKDKSDWFFAVLVVAVLVVAGLSILSIFTRNAEHKEACEKLHSPEECRLRLLEAKMCRR